MTIFFAGAFAGAGVTFLAMCFAFCAGRTEREDKGNEDVGIPCYYCKYAFSPACMDCIDLTLCHMCDIAEDMILRGEY